MRSVSIIYNDKIFSHYFLRPTSCPSVIYIVVLQEIRIYCISSIAETFAEEPEAIVGGQPAKLGEFPHQVSLREDGSHICGGSIIAPTKILTAAHCVEGTLSLRSLKIATGTTQLNGGELHSVAKIVMHPEYSDRVEDAWKNDVAVITVS